MITFPMSSRREKEFYCFDLLSDLLSNGTSSRMYNDLVQEKKVFTAIDAVVSADDDKGLFIVLGKYADKTPVKRGEELIWQSLKNIFEEEITDKEFQKVKNKNLVNTEFNNIKILDKAMNLAYYEHLDMLDNINKDREIYSSIKKEEVVNLAKQTFFVNKHNTLYYLKEEK